MRKSLFYNNY